MTDLRQHAVEIHEQFSEQLDLTVDEIEERLETLVSEYRVPVEEARRSVVSTYLDEADVNRDQLAGGDQAAEIADIDAPEEWLDLTAKVVELWEPRASCSRSMSASSRYVETTLRRASSTGTRYSETSVSRRSSMSSSLTSSESENCSCISAACCRRSVMACSVSACFQWETYAGWLPIV